MSADASLLKDLLSQVIRVGFVVARDEERLRVRVEVTDTTTDALTTDFLQVIVPRAKKDRCYDLPDIGDQVLCLFLPFGREVGFVLGSMYGADSPPVSSGDKDHRTYDDGTVIEYDRATHVLKADVKGRAEITTTLDIDAKAGTSITATAGQDVTITAPMINLNGNVTSKGVDGGTGTVTETVNRSNTGTYTNTGNATFNGNVVINGNLTTSGNSHANSRSGGPI